MNLQNRKTGILIILLAILLSTVACSFGGIQVSKGSARITVNLSEDQMNQALKHNNDRIEDKDLILKDITRVDLQEGLIRVYGPYDRPDGSEAEGSYDMAISAENGRLKAEVVKVDIEGVTLEDPRIQRTNEELEKDLEETYTESNNEVDFETVEITDREVKIVIETKIQDQP